MSLVAVSGNVSFITSIGDAGLMIPASESPFLYSILKDLVNKDTLLDLFKGSITKISTYLNDNQKSSTYCAAGLQELNNKIEVHNAVNEIIGEDFKFICKNTVDAFGGAYTTSGFIIAGFDSTKFKEINADLQNKIYVYSRQQNGASRNVEESDKLSCYSFFPKPIAEKAESIDSKYMAIRDLGIPYEFKKDDKPYVFLKNDSSPDSGRCIGMVVKMKNSITADTPPPPPPPTSLSETLNPIDVIHINCHMVNPAALKVFQINSGEQLMVTVDGKKYDVTNIESNQTILQLDDKYTDEWLNYCVERLQTCITEMLTDFELTIDQITEDTKFVLTGDLNDSDGKLVEKLNVGGIQISGKTIKFTLPSKKLLTSCPNVNSTKVAVDGMDIDTKKRNGFNKSLNYLTSLINANDKSILDTHYLIKKEPPAEIGKLVTNPANYAFEGDVVLFGKITGEFTVENGFVDSIGELPSSDKVKLNVTTQEQILQQTSDHLFVWGSTKSSMGGNKKTKKRYSKKGGNKKTKKRYSKKGKKNTRKK